MICSPYWKWRPHPSLRRKFIYREIEWMGATGGGRVFLLAWTRRWIWARRVATVIGVLPGSDHGKVRVICRCAKGVRVREGCREAGGVLWSPTLKARPLSQPIYRWRSRWRIIRIQVRKRLHQHAYLLRPCIAKIAARAVPNRGHIADS